MVSRRTRTVLALVLAVLVVTAGCTTAEDAGDAAEPAEDAPDHDAIEGDGADDSAADGGNGADAQPRPAIEDRTLIRTGTVTLEVDSFEESREEIGAIAEDRGGFVSDSSRRLHRTDGANYTTGAVVIRVPAEEFEATLAAIEEEGTVLDSRTETRDVTDRVVDIEARLATLEAQRERLRDLYDEADDTEEVLEIESHLTDVQEEIERLEAERRELEERTAYATITVELNEPRPVEPARIADDDPAWYEVGVLSALAASVEGVVTILRATVVAVAYAAPFALVFGTPLAAGYLVWRRIIDRLE